MILSKFLVLVLELFDSQFSVFLEFLFTETAGLGALIFGSASHK